MSTIAKILASLGKPATAERTSTELCADLAKVDLARLGAAVAEIEQERRKLLLSGTTEQLHENGQALADAKLEVERAGVLAEELGRLAGEAEQREKAAALQLEHEAAQREAAALASTYAAIDELAAKLADLLREASRSCVTLHRWNTKAPDRRVAAVPVETMKRKLLGIVQ